MLSSIAHELESDSVVAVILRVEDPDRMARAAQDAGSGITRARELDPFTVVSDPFRRLLSIDQGNQLLDALDGLKG